MPKSKASKKSSIGETIKRKRGRPRKLNLTESTTTRKPGRPRKDSEPSFDIPVDVPTNLAGSYRTKS